jgi:hypothetical protein
MNKAGPIISQQSQAIIARPSSRHRLPSIPKNGWFPMLDSFRPSQFISHHRKRLWFLCCSASALPPQVASLQMPEVIPPHQLLLDGHK